VLTSWHVLTVYCLCILRCSLGSSDSSLCHSGEDCSSGGGAAAVHYTVTPKTVSAATATAANISAQKPPRSGTDRYFFNPLNYL
jgi:hypothetical protein